MFSVAKGSGWQVRNLTQRLNDSIRSISVAPERAYLAVAYESGMISCYAFPQNLEQLAPTLTFRAHKAPILRCSVAPEGHYVATASSDKTVIIWDTSGGGVQQVSKLEGHSKWVWDCVFSVDAAYLVTASSDMSARLWEVASGM